MHIGGFIRSLTLSPSTRYLHSTSILFLWAFLAETDTEILQWFDMTHFWPSAARILKPGGSVAFWTIGDVIMHPSMPNAAAIQAVFDEIEERELKPFFQPGNILAKNLYIDLPLPWTLVPPVANFDETKFFRKEWSPDNSEEFLPGAAMAVDLDTLEKIQSTMSPIQRWRAAHPDLVDTERDVVRITRREAERLLHEAGVEKGKEIVKGNIKGVLIIVKKKI